MTLQQKHTTAKSDKVFSVLKHPIRKRLDGDPVPESNPETL